MRKRLNFPERNGKISLEVRTDISGGNGNTSLKIRVNVPGKRQISQEEMGKFSG
jgi:hypothetical protein